MAIPGPRLGQRSFNYVWDSSVFSWSVMAQPAVATSTQVAISSVGGVVVISGNSTVAQGTSPWVVAPNSTVPFVTRTDRLALTASSASQATVSTASATAVPSNTSRTGLVVINCSPVRMSLGLGAAAVLHKGITLYPGGTWEMGEYTMFKGAVAAVAESGSTNLLAFQEFQ